MVLERSEASDGLASHFERWHPVGLAGLDGCVGKPACGVSARQLASLPMTSAWAVVAAALGAAALTSLGSLGVVRYQERKRGLASDQDALQGGARTPHPVNSSRPSGRGNARRDQEPLRADGGRGYCPTARPQAC